MRNNQDGFVSVSIAFGIALIVLATAGSGYAIYRYKTPLEDSGDLNEQVADDPPSLEEELEQIPEGEDSIKEEESIDTSDSDASAEQEETYTPPQLVAPTPIPNEPAAKTTESQNFSIRCKVVNSEDERININEGARLSLNIWEGNSDAQEKNYDISWYGDGGSISIEGDKKLVLFNSGSPGYFDPEVAVTHLETGDKKTDSCSISVYCDEYWCQSDEGKKIWKLNLVLDRIEVWEDSPYLCEIDESVVRAYVYDYNLIKGDSPSAPEFDKEVDCENRISISAYEYKIRTLKISISES